MADKYDLRGGLMKMREVAELLSEWADNMERSLDREKEGQGAASEVPVAPEACPAAQISFEELRGLLAGKSAAGFRTQVLALIRSYGAEKLSEVDPAHYGELAEAAGLLGGEADAG